MRKPKPEPTALPIAEGAYRLLRDVKNPSPDKRQQYDWTKLPVWEEGDAFVAVTDSFDVDGREVHRTTILKQGDRGTLYAHETAQWNALVGSLSAVPHTVATLYVKYAAHHWHPQLVAQKLVEMGKVTVEDVEAALQFEDERPVTETSKLFAKRG